MDSFFIWLENASWQVLELGELIKTKQVTSKELVRIYLKQLKRYGGGFCSCTECFVENFYLF